MIAAGLSWAGNRVAAGSSSSEGIRPRWVVVNHAGHDVLLTEGPVAVLSALAGLLAEDIPPGQAAAIAVATAGAGVVGAVDDHWPAAQAKGFRGHLGALRQGQVTSGTIKIAGIGATALVASLLQADSRAGGRLGRLADIGTGAVLIAGTANLVNLLDLRPGRAAKVSALLALLLSGSGGAAVLGAALGSLPTDLTAQSMLGDCGANALGSGIGAAATGCPRPVRLVALLAVCGLNVASEMVSFTAVIEGHRLLRSVDGWGRRGHKTTNEPT